LLVLFPLFTAVLGLQGCGTYYDAEIAGYVKDMDTDAGINGAVIRMYLTEDDITAEEEAEDGSVYYIVETASMSSQGNDGYFSHKIMWQNAFGEFGSEGDSGEVWLKITHEDYIETTAQVSGILSDTINLVPDILLDRATFSTPQLRGRVLNVSGEGVNGVRVVLDLSSTTEETEDYITTTGFSDGEPGYYIFQEVTWRDEEPDSDAADTESASVSIDDPDYEYGSTLAVTLTSSQASEAPDDIVVTRKPRTQFSTNVTGRCFARYDNAGIDPVDIPVQGVEVTITYDDGNGSHTLYDQTDGTGSFGLLIQWTDTSPGDFIEGTPDSSVPDGEDGLEINIDYDDANFTDLTNFNLKSWLNPNYIPDGVYDADGP